MSGVKEGQEDVQKPSLKRVAEEADDIGRDGDGGCEKLDEGDGDLAQVMDADLETRLEWAEVRFRKSHDTDLEWLHRKAFIAAHVGHYPLQRLASLAACYCNSVVMGCRYPKAVMDELSTVEDETIRAVEMVLANQRQSGGRQMMHHLRRG